MGLTTAVCPRCGNELGEDGLCDMCFLAGGLDSTSGPSLAETVAGDSMSAATALEYDHFGPYQILRVLGEGGMGSVYLARQTAPIQREVALKVVKPGMDTSQILARFNYERQTLASMDHPNIAHVFDAGATEKGRPYFVMEYIVGEPITTYCDRKHMTTRQRLQLFLPVCQALQHAHQKGIIHRDIKPSNVLVTEIDGRPVPKVIDFGIAKATEQVSFDRTAFTELGQFVGTPEYMSPEAADVMSGDVDTSSDVYSLGILLYELLIGTVPFDAKTLRRAGLAELLRIVREEEAPPMTAKLTQMGEAAVNIAEHRRTDLPSLKRAIQGDLNWIVTKAVEKSRQRRYPSASEMLADVERHLNDEPVLASPPSKFYWTWKFVRRNRALVIGSAAVVAALIFGLIGTVWQAREAEGGRAEALRQKSAAEKALALAESRGVETQQQRVRAEQEAKRALDQEDRARQEEQRALRSEALAQANLAEARGLANSMLFDLNDKVKDLGGSMSAQESLVRIGTQSLSKSSAGDPNLGAAYLRLGELQGPNGLWDVEGARESYRQSIVLLERKWASSHDQEAGRQLALAYSRQSSLEDDWKPRKAGQRKADKLLDELLKSAPVEPTLLGTVAEIKIAEREPAKALEYLSKLNRPSLADRAFQAAAQQALAEATEDEDVAQALDWSLKSVQSMNSLVNEAPQNATFRMQQADSLRVSARLLAELNRYTDAFANARKAVSIGQELAAMDPNQSNFQWLEARAEVQLAALLAQNDEPEAAQRLIDTASGRMAAQTARYPKAAYLAVKYALVMARAGNEEVNAGNFIVGGAKFSDVMYALTRAEQASPNSRIVKRWKVQLSWQLGYAAAQRGDMVTALRTADDAVGIAERLQDSPSFEDRYALAYAIFIRGRMLARAQRFSEAIADMKNVAAAAELLGREEPPLDLAMMEENIDTRDLWQRAQYELYLCNRQAGDLRAALEAAKAAWLAAEKEYATRPRSYAVNNLLGLALFGVRVSYLYLDEEEPGLEAAKRCLEVAKRYFLSHPSETRSFIPLISSYINLSTDLLRNGRLAEGLSVAREGARYMEATYLGVHSVEVKATMLTGQLFLVRMLRDQGDQPEEAARHGKTAIGWAEALVREDPGNRSKKKSLGTAYRNTAHALLHTKDLGQAIVYWTKGLEIQREMAENSAADWISVGLNETEEASLFDRMIPGTGLEGWRKTLDTYQKALAMAGQAYRMDLKNLRALSDMFRCERDIAKVYGFLGDSEAENRWSESALQHADAASKAAPENKTYGRQAVSMKGLAFRARQRAGRAKADFRSLEGGAQSSSDQIDEELATGYLAMTKAMANDSYRPTEQVREAEQAVELARASLRIRSTEDRRILLAQSLQQLGQSLKTVAESAPAEYETLLRRALTVTRESLELFAPLDREKRMPEDSALDFRAAKLLSAQLEERLRISL